MNNWTLGHVGYVVRKMEPAIKRFQKEGASVIIPVTEDPVQGVYVALLSMTGDCDIELVSPMDEKNSVIKGRLDRQGGLDHLCFTVPQLDQALKEEEERGSMVVCRPTYAVAFDADIAFVHRRSGIVVELMAFREGSKYR